jgi:hypothetical protein
MLPSSLEKRLSSVAAESGFVKRDVFYTIADEKFRREEWDYFIV